MAFELCGKIFQIIKYIFKKLHLKKRGTAYPILTVTYSTGRGGREKEETKSLPIRTTIAIWPLVHEEYLREPKEIGK